MATQADATAPAASASSGDGESFFHHILDVINPLQHLPVVGTIYRAITGEHIGPIEKIAGDALYGGLWGAVTSVADVAFESLTGKSVESTVLALFKHDDTQVAPSKVTAPRIASAAPLPSGDLPPLPSDTMAVASNLPDSRELAALTTSLSAKGVDRDLAGRALYAYRRSMDMTGLATGNPTPLLASLH